MIEFSTPEHANGALNYNVLIGREVYAGVVFNRPCKSLQCFRCYSYQHITVQFTNKEACAHFSDEHSFKNCPGNLTPRCTLYKGNYKAWDRVCPLKKQETDCIAQALLLTPHRYPTNKPTTRIINISLDKDVFYEADIDITPPLSPPGEQTENAKSKNNRPARFLVAGSLLIARLTSKKHMRSRSRSPVRTIRNGLTSPKKNFTPRENNKEMASSLSFTQSKRTPMGPRDTNAVSTRSMRPPNSSPLA